MRQKYHDNMTQLETQQLLRELAMLDNAYAAAERQGHHGLLAYDEVEELRRAALDHKGRP